MKANTVEEGVAALNAGKMIIVVDSEDRDDEGDLINVAEHATARSLAFMARYGSGGVCVALECRAARRAAPSANNGKYFVYT